MPSHRIRITNHADHSVETLAMDCATTLLPAEESVIGGHDVEFALAKVAVAKALAAHHEAARTEEHAALDAASEHFGAPIDERGRAAAALADIRAAVAGTPWTAHFDGEDGEAVALSALTTHFNTTTHAARQWKAREAGAPVAASPASEFLAQHNGA